MIVGAPFVANGNVSNFTGSAYVIYGQRNADPGDVDMANVAGGIQSAQHHRGAPPPKPT